PPRPATVAQALALLRRMDALDDDGVTDLGRVMARLPVHPRLGRLLIEGQRWGQPERIALAAALLAERDPFARSLDGPPAAPSHASASDVLDRVEALEAFEHFKRTSSSSGSLNTSSARFLLRARDQLLRTVRQEAGRLPATAVPPDEAVL